MTISIFRSDFLVVRQDPRHQHFKFLSDEELRARATRQPATFPAHRSLEVLCDQFKEQGFEQLASEDSLLPLLEPVEPWKTWHRMARDKYALVEWWLQWGAWNTSVELFVEQVQSVVVTRDSLRIELQNPHNVLFALPPGMTASAEAGPFLRSFTATHEFLRANELEVGFRSAQEQRADLSRQGIRGAQRFMLTEDSQWYVDVDGIAWRMDSDGTTQRAAVEPAEVVMQALQAATRFGE